VSDARPPQLLHIAYRELARHDRPFCTKEWLVPIAPLSIRAHYVPGRTNSERAISTAEFFQLMHRGNWRRLFGQGDFPFYQLSASAGILSLAVRTPRATTHGAETRESTSARRLQCSQCLTRRSLSTQAIPDNTHCQGNNSRW